MYQELVNIDMKKGLDGLLPQNLPNELLYEMVEAIEKIGKDNLNPKKLLGIEKMYVNVHTDILNSIMLYGKRFSYFTAHEITYNQFNDLFKTIRSRIIAEMLRRETGKYVKYEIPTVESLLKPINKDK